MRKQSFGPTPWGNLITAPRAALQSAVAMLDYVISPTAGPHLANEPSSLLPIRASQVNQLQELATDLLPIIMIMEIAANI